MKVNTDGVLLGAWTEVKDAKSILDIGTGTGVIALMMAQKNDKAIIDAVDIDEDAFCQAKENFEQSPWSERVKAVHSSLQEFNSDKKYDVIISNPPYFVDDLKTANHQKNLAKHSVALSYKELISGISRLLASTGKVFIVIPVFNFHLIQEQSEKESLFITRFSEVVPVKGKSSYLALLQLEREKHESMKEIIEIQDVDGKFTKRYKELTKDFYLKF